MLKLDDIRQAPKYVWPWNEHSEATGDPGVNIISSSNDSLQLTDTTILAVI